MPFTKNDSKEAVKTNYEFTIIRAKVVNDTKVNFAMRVNGVTIFGMNMIEYTNNEGNTGIMITFPQWKGEKDGKETWNNYVDFPMTKELREAIIEAVKAKI